MGIEIKDYVDRAKNEPTRERIEEMWRAVFLLQGWYFLPSRSDDGPAFPTVVEIDKEPWVLIFTNVREIKTFARQQGRSTSDGSTPLLVLDPLESMERILAEKKTLAGAIFNPDSEATFRAPLEALEAYAHHFGLPLDGGESNEESS